MDYKDITEKYLEYALTFNNEEKTNIKTLADWFPEKIIDCHAHCNLLCHVGKVSQKSLNSMISTFFYHSVDDSRKINQLLYPKSEVSALRFPNVFNGIDHKSANAYLLETSRGKDGVAIFGLPEDVEYTISILKYYKPNALKMYYFYPEQTARTIYETFPEEILKVAEDLGIPSIVHLPKVITECKNDLLNVLKKYPKLKICVPHLGSTKFLIPELEEVYRELAQSTNIFLDTSLNPSREVLKLAFKYFGPERIMFGSDQPLNLVRARSYVNPIKGQRLITEYKYHWVDNNEHTHFRHLAKNLVHTHWSSIFALKSVIDEFPNSMQEKIKEMIFYKNAHQFYNFT